MYNHYHNYKWQRLNDSMYTVSVSANKSLRQIATKSALWHSCRYRPLKLRVGV